MKYCGISKVHINYTSFQIQITYIQSHIRYGLSIPFQVPLKRYCLSLLIATRHKIQIQIINKCNCDHIGFVLMPFEVNSSKLFSNFLTKKVCIILVVSHGSKILTIHERILCTYTSLDYPLDQNTF